MITNKIFIDTKKAKNMPSQKIAEMQKKNELQKATEYASL